MKKYKIGIAGRGRVGVALSEFLISRRKIDTFVLYNKKEIEKYNGEEDIDIWILTIPDYAILKHKDKFKNFSNMGVLHTSGTLPRMKGIEKLHPFAMIGKKNINDLSGIYWGIHKGELLAFMFVKDILDSKFFYLPNDYDPILYHTAAVLSSSLLFALSSISIELFERLGIENREPIYSIIRSTLDVIESEEIDYMAGPVIRNDAETLNREELALKAIDKKYAQVYKILSDILKDKLKR